MANELTKMLTERQANQLKNLVDASREAAKDESAWANQLIVLEELRDLVVAMFDLDGEEEGTDG